MDNSLERKWTLEEEKSVNGTKLVLVKHTGCQIITRSIYFYRLTQGQYYHMYKCLTASIIGESKTLGLRNLLKVYTGHPSTVPC